MMLSALGRAPRTRQELLWGSKPGCPGWDTGEVWKQKERGILEWGVPGAKSESREEEGRSTDFPLFKRGVKSLWKEPEEPEFKISKRDQEEISMEFSKFMGWIWSPFGEAQQRVQKGHPGGVAATPGLA